MLYLYSSLLGKKVLFEPVMPEVVSMYVCGPTVYDRIHLGNARSLVVFDVLYRLLRHLFSQVIYVRNITDIDDKINAAARLQNCSIQELTQKTIADFRVDSAHLHLLPPTYEPKATEHMAQIISIIMELLEKKVAYVAHGHVLFSVKSCANYGQLSQANLDQMKAGARVEIAPYKKDPLDFVLWKPSQAHEPRWESPWGWGRPGWHTECSAMSLHYLGQVFDIHGGGTDLRFPHHENERAQSCVLSGRPECAHHWLYNGMLVVEGKKMSKSLGNFITLHQALQIHKGEIIRWALLLSHYRQILDWTEHLLQQAKCMLAHMYQAFRKVPAEIFLEAEAEQNAFLDAEFLKALYDDMNTPAALNRLHHLSCQLHSESHNSELAIRLKASANLIGLGQYSCQQWFCEKRSEQSPLSTQTIEGLIEQRHKAREEKNFVKADSIRSHLLSCGVILEDLCDGHTVWRFR